MNTRISRRVLLLGGLAAFLGVVLTSRAYIPGLVRAAGRLLPGGIPSRLAAANAARYPTRTSTTATALLIALWIEHATDLVPEAPLTTWPILLLALMPLLGGARLVARHREILRLGDEGRVFRLHRREPCVEPGRAFWSGEA